MFNLFHCCTRSLGPFPDNIHAPRQWTRPQLSSHSADPTSASSTTFPPFHASLPSRFKGHHQTGVRRVQKVQLRRPTTPFLPPFYFFEIFASSSGYPYHQILSLDWLHPYSSILESLIAVLITVHVFLRSPLWPAVQLSPPTSVSLRHPPPCIMAITLTNW